MDRPKGGQCQNPDMRIFTTAEHEGAWGQGGSCSKKLFSGLCMMNNIVTH